MMVSAREWVAIGEKFFQQKDYQRAEDYLRRVVKQNPNYADVQNMLGVIYHSQGRFSDAIQSFEQALTINAQYSEALLNLAVLYNDLGQYKEARKLYERLRKRNGAGREVKSRKSDTSQIEPVLKGKLSNMHADIGDIYFGLGLYQQAIEEYRRALELNPAYTDILTKLGIALREYGKLAESEKTLREACKLNAKYLQARVQLGVTLYTMGKNQEALKTWRETLKTDPHHPAAEMYLHLCDTK